MPTVLLVDDHPSFRATARLLLEADGFDIVGEAATGEEGLSEAERLHPDVVLLDVGLPDIDGFGVLAELGALPDVPAVVLVSSREAADYGGRVDRSGAAGFISKAELSAGTLARAVGRP